MNGDAVMATYDDIARAIGQKNGALAIRLLFTGKPPTLRFGRNLETELWDFKNDCPPPAKGKSSDIAWAHIAADVLAFHNARGGLIIFGIEDKRFEFVGATHNLDSKIFNDKIRKYVGDLVWVDYHREHIQPDQRYLGVAVIPPRGPAIARFKSPAPRDPGGKGCFERGGAALREGDSTLILDPAATDRYARQQSAPVYGDKYSVNEPYFRILAPEYAGFLERPLLHEHISKSLADPRVAVTSLIGVGGMGKTALATYVANAAYDQQRFQFIVSTTAKDRELTATGILGMSSELTSYENLLDQTAMVLGEAGLRDEPVDVKERQIRLLIEDGNGLFYVDNLETVDDKRMITFLDDLPLGVRALVTSRRNSVRTAARPIDVPPLTDKEMIAYIRLLSTERPFQHASSLSDAEVAKVGRAWDGIPLAIRWALSRSKSVSELVSQANQPLGMRLKGEELLEFSFRRVFENLTSAERGVLETLCVLEKPIPTEAVVAGVGLPDVQVLDAIDELADDAIVNRVFDADRNDYCYTILPITRAFLRHDLQSRPKVSRSVQHRLTAWFEATDLGDDDERLLVRELRSGRTADDSALVDLALSAQRRGDLNGAERLFKQALARNPRSWRAARGAAEFFRHQRRNMLEAIALYEIAAAHAPRQGADRAAIFRDWGLLLRDAGQPDSAAAAEEKLLTALEEAPEDAVIRHGLATCYDRRGAYRKVIEVLSPYKDYDSSKPRPRNGSIALLLKAYEKTNELLAAADLRQKLGVNET